MKQLRSRQHGFEPRRALMKSPSLAFLAATAFVALLSTTTAATLPRIAPLMTRTGPATPAPVLVEQAGVPLEFPAGITKLHINIGPNTSPLSPPRDDASVAVLAVEPNTGIAHHLRETFQKRRHVSRFFVLNCAISGAPLAGHPATFRHYNAGGVSSSLGRAAADATGRLPAFAAWRGHGQQHDGDERFGPGRDGVDFVPVLSLEALLGGVPTRVDVPLLKIDAQGFDLDIVKSARRETVRRVRRIVAETYGRGAAGRRYEGVRNELVRDWVPYMRSIGFRLCSEAAGDFTERDAVWERVD